MAIQLDTAAFNVSDANRRFDFLLTSDEPSQDMTLSVWAPRRLTHQQSVEVAHDQLVRKLEGLLRDARALAADVVTRASP